MTISTLDTTHSQKHIAIIGGGAAGFFAAITAAEANPAANVTIYERSQHTLSKVKISGGGRCNVTHSCFDPAKLASHYPRGSRELRGAFHRWQPQDTIHWFAERDVTLKTEADGRMFPDTDDSQTIIDCFHTASGNAGVKLLKGVGLKGLSQNSNGSFNLKLTDDTQAHADAICIATGSLKTAPLTQALETLGHTIEPLAPSLFAFNIADKRTHGLAGLSVQNASVSLVASSLATASTRKSKSLAQTGPILITHRGFSGPAILRLSAWEARSLQDQNYHFDIIINWLGDQTENQVREQFDKLRKHKGRTFVKSKIFKAIPRRLWERIVEAVGISAATTWSQLSKAIENTLIHELIAARFSVQGKTTNKDEFVTCGGVRLKEVDLKTMQSRKVSGLYFAGECLDIDGITGGFNFQAAWTGGRIAGLAMAKE
ncbi:MAG TPA: aminoacetone oxidase family FAD-binding enzyme [Opitutae bacterium]|jgi:predicted Rossmann fold flavoprotein|nr:aminoacetone oxidase family FAD-binding enzyme [Opitutae bacterium]HBR66998.1 aminoacetone oxidase family FAD-binding enzyme [Opitutae bacterium]